MIRVLVAEDELLEMKYLTKIITSHECMELVHSSQNGQSAVDYARSNPVDVAILDIKMPVMGGLRATELIKEIDKNIKIIINTAYAEFELAQKALHIGADEYLVKPVKDYMLIETIENLHRNAQKGQVSNRSCNDHYNLEDYPLTEEKTLLSAMQHFDIKLFKRSFADFSHSVLISSKSNAVLRHCLNDFVLELSRTLILTGSHNEEVNHFRDHFSARIEESDGIHVLKMILTDIEQYVVKALMIFDASSVYQVQNILQYIHNNYHEDLSLKSLCGRFHFSESYLSRCISRETKMSFPRYLNKLRIEQAMHLLKNSNLKVNEIALEVGYRDTSHFNRTFKAHCDMTPSGYRSQQKED